MIKINTWIWVALFILLVSLSYRLSWWTIILLPAILTLCTSMRRLHAAGLSFILGSICWIVLANIENSMGEHEITARVAALFDMGTVTLYLAAGIVGGLSAVLGSLAGGTLRDAFRSNSTAAHRVR